MILYRIIWISLIIKPFLRAEKDRVYYDYNGATRLYDKFGFKEVAIRDGQVIMRKMM